jgi:hypothetical protein
MTAKKPNEMIYELHRKGKKIIEIVDIDCERESDRDKSRPSSK